MVVTEITLFLEVLHQKAAVGVVDKKVLAQVNQAVQVVVRHKPPQAMVQEQQIRVLQVVFRQVVLTTT